MSRIEASSNCGDTIQQEVWRNALIGAGGRDDVGKNNTSNNRNKNEEETVVAATTPGRKSRQQTTSSTTTCRNWTTRMRNILSFLHHLLNQVDPRPSGAMMILLVLLSISVLFLYSKMDSSLQNYIQKIQANQPPFSTTSIASTLVFPPPADTAENLIENLFPMCVGQHHVILPVANASMLNKTICSLARVQVNCSSTLASSDNVLHELPFDPNKLPNYYYTRDQIVFWQDDMGRYTTANTLLTGSREQPPAAPSLTNHNKEWPSLATLPFTNKTVLFLDSCMGAMQFGHALTQVIRLIILGEVGFHGDHLVNFYNTNYTRWRSVSIDSILDILVTNAEQRRKQRTAAEGGAATQENYYIRARDLDLATPTMTRCFRNPVRALCQGERYYWSLEDVYAVQSFVRREYPWFAPTTQSCPPPSAAVLYRSGLGAGLRKILDYNVIDKALRANGIKKYTNITVSQDTTFEESLRLFSSFGILIATHSSQLKLLAFSHPNTIVVELRPKEAADWFGHSVFSEGPDVLGIHYYSSNAHTAAKCPMSEELCQRKGNIYSDIWPNVTVLTEHLRDGLRAQRLHCKLYWK
jgi:hypothetical protein